MIPIILLVSGLAVLPLLCLIIVRALFEPGDGPRPRLRNDVEE